MQVLYLALGASRKQAVVKGSAELIASGSQVVVLVGPKKQWNGQKFADGVLVLSTDELENRHLPRKLERMVLYQGPRRVVRAIGRGPLRKSVKRAHHAYKRRVASTIHRRMFMPLHRRVWPDASDRLIPSLFPSPGGPDLLIVSDAFSTVRAVKLLDRWAAEGRTVPRVSYDLPMPIPAVR
jgi:hypothetical protein